MKVGVGQFQSCLIGKIETRDKVDLDRLHVWGLNSNQQLGVSE